MILQKDDQLVYLVLNNPLLPDYRMAIFRQISSTFTPCSDCLIEKTICASVNFDFFMCNFSGLMYE